MRIALRENRNIETRKIAEIYRKIYQKQKRMKIIQKN